jgi:hypothetical protein
MGPNNRCVNPNATLKSRRDILFQAIRSISSNCLSNCRTPHPLSTQPRGKQMRTDVSLYWFFIVLVFGAICLIPCLPTKGGLVPFSAVYAAGNDWELFLISHGAFTVLVSCLLGVTFDLRRARADHASTRLASIRRLTLAGVMLRITVLAGCFGAVASFGFSQSQAATLMFTPTIIIVGHVVVREVVRRRITGMELRANGTSAQPTVPPDEPQERLPSKS